MSAETLREAAALMRSRAEFAPDSPWIADVRHTGQSWIDVPDEDGHAWGMHGFPAAARHVASWHPAVALAVADWLDATAVRIDMGKPRKGGVLPGRNNHSWRGSREAVAVARAYLGGDR